MQCSYPCPPPNGDVNFDGTNIGDVAYYSCHDNYELEGYDEIYCGEGGYWSVGVPSCTPLGNMLFSFHFNPFKPNELSYHYQQDESISNFRGVGWYF